MLNLLKIKEKINVLIKYMFQEENEKEVLSMAIVLATLGLVVSCKPGKAKSESGAVKADLEFCDGI